MRLRLRVRAKVMVWVRVRVRVEGAGYVQLLRLLPASYLFSRLPLFFFCRVDHVANGAWGRRHRAAVERHLGMRVMVKGQKGGMRGEDGGD